MTLVACSIRKTILISQMYFSRIEIENCIESTEKKLFINGNLSITASTLR
jgi:hypothetical protein